MADDRKFVRVFYSDLIRDYPDMWADDAALATWLRMLATADPMWPTPPELPRSVRPKPLAVLTGDGLVSLDAARRFRIKGLDAERSKRSDAARNAAALRWHGKGNAEAMPTRPDQTKPEQTSGPPASDDRWDAPEQAALVWLSRHGCDIRPGNGYHQKLITAVEVHGVEKILSMFDRLADAGTANGDVKGFLFGAIDALNAQTRPNLRALDKEDAGEREAVSVRRRVENTQRHLHEIGHHQDAPNPACPLCNVRAS